MRRKILPPWKRWAKTLSRLNLSLFRRPSSQILTFNMILAEHKQLLDFSVMHKSTLSKLSGNYGFLNKRCNNKTCNCINNLMLILWSGFAILGSGTGVFLKFFPIFADRIFIKSKMFSFEFRGIFHPEILLETRLRHRWVPVHCSKFLIIVIPQYICEGLLLI